MRVLHIITGLDDGGAEAVLFRLCKLDKKYQHTVISLQAKQKYESLLQKLNISVHTLNFSNSSINFFGLFKLFKLIRQIKPDVVQTWMPHADLIGGVLARIAGVKKIFWGVHHANLIKGKINRVVIMIVRLNAFYRMSTYKDYFFFKYQEKFKNQLALKKMRVWLCKMAMTQITFSR